MLSVCLGSPKELNTGKTALYTLVAKFAALNSLNNQSSSYVVLHHTHFVRLGLNILSHKKVTVKEVDTPKG